MKTDCVFLLADKQMKETFDGFLGRDKFHFSLGTRPFTLLCRASHTPRSSAIYQKIAQLVSVRNCVDPAFCLLRETLQRWFSPNIIDY